MNNQTPFSKVNRSMMDSHIFFYIYFIIYSIISTSLLTTFPRVHSDETWISGLSYDMYKANSLFVTESFFDLFPRIPHTMKVLFHALQISIIRIGGLSIFNIRLISLVFGLLSLLTMYFLLNHILKDKLISFLSTALASLTPMFIYPSHFARQEIILVFILVCTYYLYISNNKYSKLIIPILIGISISLHPNAFIIACMIGIIYLKDIIQKTKPLKDLVIYIGTIGCFAILNLLISYSKTPSFFKDYLAYGETLSVTAGPTSRVKNFYDFYVKCYEQISGTYYIPPMKLLIIGSLFLSLMGIILVIRNHQKKNSIYTHMFNSVLMLIAFNIALFIIGRYNTTSIVFILIPVILLFTTLLRSISTYFMGQQNIISIVTLSVLILLFTYDSYVEINNSLNFDYQSHLDNIEEHLPEDAILLGNLSSGLLYKDMDFYDIRNLAYLKEMTVLDYFKSNSINTIMYYEEYDYIHRNQQWDILYGEDDYYDELNEIINTYGNPIFEFEDMYYGTRIIRYMGEYPWKITIYQLDY